MTWIQKPKRRTLIVVTAAALMLTVKLPTALADGNVAVNNTTKHDVMVIMNFWTPRNGRKTAKAATWKVDAGVRSDLTVTGIPDFNADSVGFQVQNAFGVRTPRQDGKVWVADADANDRVVITITEDNVYSLPKDRDALMLLMEQSESRLLILQRAVKSANARKENADLSDDPVLFVIAVAAHQESLDSYQRAEKFHAAVVKTLTSGNSSNPIPLK